MDGNNLDTCASTLSKRTRVACVMWCMHRCLQQQVQVKKIQSYQTVIRKRRYKIDIDIDFSQIPVCKLRKRKNC